MPSPAVTQSSPAVPGQGGDTPPTANAGADQTQDHAGLVTLNGSASTGGDSHSWLLWGPRHSNETSRLSSSTAASPTFTPPEAGVWTAILTYTNTGTGLSAVDVAHLRVGNAAGFIRLRTPIVETLGGVFTRRTGQSRQRQTHRFVAPYPRPGNRRDARKPATAPKPKAVDGPFAVLFTLGIDRRGVQQNLDFIQSGVPGHAVGTGWQKRMDVPSCHFR